MDLANTVLYRWKRQGAYSLGIFNCRKIAGTETYSVHAEGRAWDCGIPAGARPELGDAILRALLAAPDGILQRIIWWQRVYDAQTPAGRPYGGDDPHESHLHIESSWASAPGLNAAQIAQLLGDVDENGDDVTMGVILMYSDVPGDTAAWLLVGGRRLYLDHWSNVQALLDKGAAMLKFPKQILDGIPTL